MKLRKMTRSELVETAKGYRDALDDMAYCVHVGYPDIEVFRDNVRKQPISVESKILISLALSAPPVRVVKGGQHGNRIH